MKAGRSRRWYRRLTAWLMVLCFLGLAQPAEAATASPGRLGFGGVTAWLEGVFASHPAAVVPTEQSGSAGRGGQVPTSATRAGQGAGNAVKAGAGQLPAYQPYDRKFTAGRAGAHGSQAAFDPATSKFVGAKSSATASWYQNADGSVTRRVSQYPVNYQVSKGVWAPVDTTLVAGAGGRLQEKANSVPISFAPASGAAGAGAPAAKPAVTPAGSPATTPATAPAPAASPAVATTVAATTDLAEVQLATGESVGWSVAGEAPVTAQVSGSTATYPGILPGASVTETSGPTGVKESIVLASAAAGNVFTFPLDARGLTPSLAPGGQVVFTDAAGKQAGEIPLAFAADSKFNPGTGRGATTWKVSYGLTEQAAGGWLLTVTVDPSWLDDPSRAFPVTIDPTFIDSIAGQDDTTYTNSGAAGDYSSDTTIETGECTAAICGSQSDAIGLISFAGGTVPVDGQGYNVTSATLAMFDSWTATPSAAACTNGTSPSTIDVAQVTQAWSVPGVKAYPGPSHGPVIGSAAPATPHACANSAGALSVGDWVSVPLSASAINAWTFGTQPDYGLAVYGATGALTARAFDSDMESSYTPYLQITYNDQAPQINAQWPPNGYSSSTLTPELLARASTTSTHALQYEFLVYGSNGTKIADSGLIASGDWTVPAGDLSWSQTYYWTVEAYDGTLYSPSPAWSALSTAVPQPLITSTLSQNSSGNGYDPASGNYTTESTDASVTTAGPSLDVTRDYNSRDWRPTGAFGSGWSSVLDAQAAQQDAASGALTSVTVTYPDGSQVGFGKNSNGTFSPPSGRFATLATVTGGYTLTDKNDTVYSFTHLLRTISGASTYGITSVTDAVGRAVTFTWSGTEITAMTSATSGRALHLTWATPTGAADPHVAAVATDPVTAGQSSTALTWTYSYSGDELAMVCPPTSSTACTKYSYTTGSQFQTAALDAGPQSLWPLTEASGTVAHSAVLANEGTDNATYANVTLGAAGPLAGSTATAASFNGSSSFVALPASLVSSASYESMSLWFKTTATNQVLFSYSKDPLTQSSTVGYYTPSIYVGSDGKLNAEYWYASGIAPIVTSAAVNDGKWHEAVLSAAGGTQTLYLDGSVVGSKSGAITNGGNVSTGTQVNDYIGGGFLGGGWPDETKKDGTTNTGYAAPFSGSIADVAFYARPLVQSDVTGLHQAGTTAADLLTSILRPSGNTYATVGYDPVTARVTSVTDGDGGTWTVGTPAVAGSSQVYRAAVLGSNPADYYRLNDQPGATNAYDEVKGGLASYNGGVTLGGAASSPFSDVTGATLDGSTGYLALPATDQITTGPNTVELWFKMAQGDANGGVLFDEQQCGLGDTSAGCSENDPALYVGTDGRLRGEFWIGNVAAQMASPGLVNDGKWHYAVLSASTSSQSLYLDGALVGTAAGTLAASGLPFIYAGAGESAGWSWPFAPADPLGHFQGSISDLAFYPSQLSAADVTTHYAAYKSAASGLAPTETVQVGDPGGKTETYAYDPMQGGRELSATDGLGNKTSYSYDSAGFLSTIVDPNGDTTVTGYDVRGNVVSQSTCQDQATGACSTSYDTYYPDDTTAQLTPNAQNDVLLTSRGDGSASAADNTYLTSDTYDQWGDQTSQTSPPVPGFPSGRTTTITYTDGTSAFPAADSGNAPAGLRASVTDPAGAVTAYTYYSDGDLATITTPLGETITYTYDNLGRVLSKQDVSDTYPAGQTTSYSYDGLGEVVSETSPPVTDRITGAVHQAVTTTGYDADGDVLSQTVADATGGDASRTMSYTYNAYDEAATATDGDSGVTKYSYDGYGNKTSETDPNGNTTSYAYDPNGNQLSTTLNGYTGSPAGSQAAANLVTDARTYDPAGRLASETDAMGFTTSFTYTDNGLPVTETRTSTVSGNSGSYVLQSNTYNAAGQMTQQVTNNGALTTNNTVDAAGRVAAQTTDPSGVDRTVSSTFDPDDRVLTQTVSSPAGSQSTAYTYDAQGDTTSSTSYGASAGRPVAVWPLNQTGGTAVPDTSGAGNTGTATNVTWSDGAAWFPGDAGQGITTQGPVLNTAGSFTVSAWANIAGGMNDYRGVVSEHSTSQDGFELEYDSSTGKWAFGRASADTNSPNWVAAESASAAQAGTWTHLAGTFDASTGKLTLYVNGVQSGTTATDTTPFAANGPLAIGQDEWAGNLTDWFDGEIGNVQAYSRVLSASEITALSSAGPTSTAVAGSGQQTTTTAYDQRGLPVSSTDPNGNTTAYSYDEAGQLAQTVEPAVSATVYSTTSGAPVTATAHPVTTIGYNTFGDKTEDQDPDGNTTTYTYDADGQLTSGTGPSYTPPGSAAVTPLTTYQYDPDGQLVKQTDPLTHTTSYAYDQLGDKTSVTTPDGKSSSYVYDADGDVLSQTDPTGAQSTATFDFMGRPVTGTQVERYPTMASLTTVNTYDGSGNLQKVTSPAGVVTSYGYDAAGEATSVTDGAGNTTGYVYDELGRQVKASNPDGTFSTASYDSAGNQTGTADFSAAGAQLRSASAAYDAAGNMISSTDAMGVTKTYAYDASGVLAGVVQPVSASSSVPVLYGYDLAGNQTAYTDGNGHSTYQTYNSLGLPESVIEPPAGANTSAAASTSTAVYDAAGDVVTQDLPGGVQVSNSYDVMGDLTGQSGSGAAAATANRSFGYDANGRVTSAATAAAGTQGSAGYQPATSEAFTYNDRGLVLSASGSAGSSSFGYNADGSMTSRTDASGTSAYTYDAAGRLATDTSPASGTTATLAYNSMDQVSSVSYGAGNDTQVFAYDGLHRLASATVNTAAGAQVASIGYGYNADDNITSMTTSGLAAPGGGTGTVTNSYTYDEAGRLTGWNNGTAHTYGYDKAGNLTSNNGVAYTYDARNELTSDGSNSYTYAADGDVTSQTSAQGAVTGFTSDAFGQQVTAGTSSYGYDALGRLLTAGTASSPVALTYSGMGDQLASDPSATYSRDPSGSVTGVDTTAGVKTIALTDLHMDLSGMFTPAGTTLAESSTFDPWGNLAASTGTAVQAGFQGGWTDPATKQVHMGARFYDPAAGQFLNQDQVATSAQGDPAAGGDLHAYVDDSPVTGTDPSGHMLTAATGGGCATAACAAAITRALTPKPAPKSCSGLSCLVHAVVAKVKAAVAVVKKAVAKTVAVAKKTVTVVKHVASVAVAKVSDAYHAAATYAVRTVKAVAATAVKIARTAVHVVVTAVYKTATAVVKVAEAVAKTELATVKAAASFVKTHAATITAIAAGVVVFAGCTALTGGVAVIGCGALAGVAASMVTQGAKCYDGQQGACSVGSFAQAAAVGGVTGALGGSIGEALGGAASGLVSAAGDALGGIFSGAAGAAGDDAAANAITDTTETAARQPPAAAAKNAGQPETPAPAGDGTAVRDFAHGTSLENAQSILNNGLNEGAARAASQGGRYAQQGSFFSFEVTAANTEGLQLAYEMGLRQGGECVVLVCRLPASTVSELENAGLARTGSIPGVSVPETVFNPGAFARINEEATWQLIKP